MSQPSQNLLLHAAADLPATFTREDLVIAAWKMFPGSFSIPGHDLPCSHRVYSALYTKAGPMKRGHFVATADGKLALTLKGRWILEHGKEGLRLTDANPERNGVAGPTAAAGEQEVSKEACGPDEAERRLWDAGKRREAVWRYSRRARVDVPTAKQAFEGDEEESARHGG